jgi:hypothetical protein
MSQGAWVRDSKDLDAGVLVFGRAQWGYFLDDAKGGSFKRPADSGRS